VKRLVLSRDDTLVEKFGGRRTEREKSQKKEPGPTTRQLQAEHQERRCGTTGNEDRCCKDEQGLVGQASYPRPRKGEAPYPVGVGQARGSDETGENEPRASKSARSHCLHCPKGREREPNGEKCNRRDACGNEQKIRYPSGAEFVTFGKHEEFDYPERWCRERGSR
jgi:hypothetical protein